MNPIDIATKLGEAIASSKEYIRLMEAEKQYKEEKEASKLVKQFREKQNILNSSAKHIGTIDITDIRRQMTVLYEKIEKNDVIKELNEALDDFLMLKHNVYDKIGSYTVIDDEVLSIGNGSGCQSGCGGCKSNNK